MKNKKSRLEMEAIKILKSRGTTITVLLGAIIAIISIIISISGKTQATNGDEADSISENVKMVKSIEGKWVPVPKGYSASKIPGEMNVNGGFVIYEGEDIDWSYWENLKNNSSIDDNVIEKVKKENSNSTNSITTINQSNITNKVDNNIADNNTINNISSNTIGNNTVDNTINFDDLENTTNIENVVNENIVENTVQNETLQNTVIDSPSVANIENVNVVENEIINTVEENTINNQNSIENVVNENIVENTISNTIVENVVNNEIVNNVVSENVNSTDDSIEKETTNKFETTEYDDSWMLEQDKNTLKIQTERNQYVWVPIENVSELFGVDEKGKFFGKMYLFSANGRNPDNWTEENGIMKIINPNGVREPNLGNNIDGRENDMLAYGNREKRYEYLSKELEQYFYKTMKSIEKYGGFYMGRYETTDFEEAVPSVKKMKEDNTNHNSYVNYIKCKKIGESNDAVTTMPVWGCLWDATLSWFVSSNAIRISDGSLITNRLVDLSSPMWGNFKYSEFKYYSDINMTISEKKYNQEKYIPTGSTEYSKVNNIYDMAGNTCEISMTIQDEDYHSIRGGGFWFVDSSLTSKFGIGNGRWWTNLWH